MALYMHCILQSAKLLLLKATEQYAWGRHHQAPHFFSSLLSRQVYDIVLCRPIQVAGRIRCRAAPNA